MKWCGKIGFAVTKEVEPGKYMPEVAEHTYYGDVMSSRWKKHQTSDQANDDINISNIISVVMADVFIHNHCSEIAYVEYMGANWKVTDIENKFPRLLLTMGGVYNG